jgi:hypothetical protein
MGQKSTKPGREDMEKQKKYLRGKTQEKNLQKFLEYQQQSMVTIFLSTTLHFEFLNLWLRRKNLVRIHR